MYSHDKLLLARSRSLIIPVPLKQQKTLTFSAILGKGKKVGQREGERFYDSCVLFPRPGNIFSHIQETQEDQRERSL